MKKKKWTAGGTESTSFGNIPDVSMDRANRSGDAWVKNISKKKSFEKMKSGIKSGQVTPGEWKTSK